MASTRTFEVTPSQYEVFRFSLPRRTTVNINMIATEPVNIVVLDSDEMYEYEHGELSTHDVTEVWNGRVQLSKSIRLSEGTWYLIVEGHKAKSTGKILLSP